MKKGEVRVLQDNFLEVYDKFKLEFFRRIFELVRERDGALTVTESFALVIIYAPNVPKTGRFAACLNISQSNATYKVNSLIKKGYLKKQNSDTDRREYHLVLSEKYYNYTDIMRSYVKTVLGRIEDSFSHEETELFSNMLMRISAEMMPEAGNFE